MSIYRSLAFGALLAVLTCHAAQAGLTIVYGNTSNGSGSSYPVSSLSPLGASFFTGASPDLALSDVQISLSNGGAGGGGSIAVTLNADVAGSPSAAPILTLGTVQDSALTSGFTLFDFWGQGAVLSANATYWIIVSDALSGDPAEQTTAQWQVASNLTETGVTGSVAGGAISVFGTLILANSDASPLVMQVEMPEPVSLALMGVGLAGLAWVQRRGKSNPRNQ